MGETLNMSVSQVFSKDGEKYAFVSFQDQKRAAEGRIPDCVITHNNGFSADEVAQLEDYMRRDLAQLKRMASEVNVMHAFMKK